jgi:hypothetical protein
MFSQTANPKFATKVQGVVVQAKIYLFSLQITLNFTVIALSCLSW